MPHREGLARHVSGVKAALLGAAACLEQQVWLWSRPKPLECSGSSQIRIEADGRRCEAVIDVNRGQAVLTEHIQVGGEGSRNAAHCCGTCADQVLEERGVCLSKLVCSSESLTAHLA